MICRAGRSLLATCLVVGAAAFTSVAEAAPGDLDDSFGKHGKFSDLDSAEAVAVQADRKTLLLGRSSLNRLNPNGSADKPFGTGRDDGATPVGFPESYSGPRPGDVVVQPDGKILVGGYINAADETASFAVARFDSDGVPDPSFGAGGVTTLPLAGTGALSERGTQLALGGDGRIVIAGEFGGAPQVARLLATGQADPGLGGDGSVTVAMGAGAVLEDVAVAQNGSIVVAGGAGSVESADFSIARLQPGGTPDTSFSSDGIETTDFGARDVASGVAILPGGAIVAAGTTSGSCSDPSCRDRFAVARYASGGGLDLGFGSGGTVVTTAPRGIDATAAGMGVQSDGKIVVAGGGGDLFVARYDPDGSPDSSFGEGGQTWTPIRGTYPAYGLAMALAPDDRIVVGGLVYVEEYYDFGVLARYEVADGPPDRDADSVADANDRCPRTSGSHRTGCPLIKRKLKLRRRHHGERLTARIKVDQVSGEPLAGYRAATALICAGSEGGEVTLYERRPGRDRRVKSASSAGRLKAKGLSPGSYYARAERAFPTAFEPDGPVELCRVARSRLAMIR